MTSKRGRAPVSKLTIVGGGPYAGRLCELLAAEPGLPCLELSLHARRADRVRLVAAHAASRVGRARPDWRVRAAASLEEAVDGADVVVLLVRVGGLEARAHDERFPARFGEVGDEGLGLGGLANAWRTVPVLESIAATLAQRAPRALMLNLMAPLGITTRLLLDLGLDALGVCELPSTTEARIRSALGPACGDALDYLGLNHLGWFWPRDPGDTAPLHRIAREARIDPGVLERFGAAPLHYYYEVFEPETGERIGYRRDPERAAALLEIREDAMAEMARCVGGELPALEARPTPWFSDALIPMLRAQFTGEPFAGFANLENNGQVEGLPSRLVLEMRVRHRGGRAESEPPARIPGGVFDFLAQVGHAELLAYRAARSRDARLLGEAVEALPLETSPGLTEAIVDEIRLTPTP